MDHTLLTIWSEERRRDFLYEVVLLWLGGSVGMGSIWTDSWSSCDPSSLDESSSADLFNINPVTEETVTALLVITFHLGSKEERDPKSILEMETVFPSAALSLPAYLFHEVIRPPSSSCSWLARGYFPAMTGYVLLWPVNATCKSR